MKTKNFKETGIGFIPEDWEVGIFGNDLKVKGRIGWKGYKRSDLVEFGPIVLGGSNIDSNIFINTKEVKYLSREKYDESPEIKLNKEDILLVTRGNLGDVGYFDGSIEEATINPSIVILSEFKYDSKFLFYYLISKQGRENVLSISSGSSVPAIYQADVKKLEYPQPSLLEQKNIAEILFSIDSKIQINQKMNQTLEEIGQAIFKQCFVHFEFPNEEGKPYKSSGGEMVDSELGEIPKGWEVQDIGNVIETTGGGTPSTKKDEYWENGDIQWFSPRDITANRQMFISNSEKMINTIGLGKSSAKLFPPYSLMMTSRATVGELSINSKEACTNQGFITCIPNERLSTFYLYYWIKMNKEYIISLASGSTFREISKSTFRSLKVVIPDGNILKYYDSLLEPIFNQIQTLQSQNENLSQIRDSLLPKLMSGKIRVIK